MSWPGASIAKVASCLHLNSMWSHGTDGATGPVLTCREARSGEYKDKVPLNFNGLSPAFVPSIGYQINDRWASRLSFLGTNALMFQFSYMLPQ